MTAAMPGSYDSSSSIQTLEAHSSFSPSVTVSARDREAFFFFDSLILIIDVVLEMSIFFKTIKYLSCS